ncbi:TolC family protein [Candidatus Poribacteria bacterium]
MWKLLFVAMVALIAVPISGVPGEDNAEIDVSKPLTLDQCIEIALKQSSNIRIANLNLTSAKLDVDDARANYWPEVDVSAQYRFSDRIDFGWDRQNYDAQIAAGYTIWDHGRREIGLAQAKADQLGVQSDYSRTKQDLIFSITAAYYDLLEAGKLIDVNEKLVEISRGNVEKATAFQETGRGIPADVAAARVQQANDELGLVNAQNNLELARADLASRMGLNPIIPIEVVDTDETAMIPETTEVSLEDSMAKAIQNRPELIRLRVRATSLEWSLRLARLDRWPIISAQYDYNVLLDDYLRDRDNFKTYRNWSAAVTFSFPIFDGGASIRREQNAEIAVQQIEEDISDSERAVMLDVEQAYLDLERAAKSLDIAGKQVKDATESLNVMLGRYEQDMVIFLEVLDVQARYAQALINEIRAFYDYKIAEKSMLRAMGALRVED